MSIEPIVLATLTGIITGAVFALANVPIPAPPKLAGIMGIVGIYLGYQFVEQWASITALLPI